MDMWSKLDDSDQWRGWGDEEIRRERVSNVHFFYFFFWRNNVHFYDNMFVLITKNLLRGKKVILAQTCESGERRACNIKSWNRLRKYLYHIYFILFYFWQIQQVLLETCSLVENEAFILYVSWVNIFLM